jgi:peptidoglycan L-alanyl-D-glutamate endopeptidase CwlK
MDYKFSKKSLDTLKTVDGRLQALAHVVLANSEHDFGIPSTGGLRTSEEQNKLYKKGWSKLDGYNKKSYHQSGLAIDIAVYDKHGLCYDCN